MATVYSIELKVGYYEGVLWVLNAPFLVGFSASLYEGPLNLPEGTAVALSTGPGCRPRRRHLYALGLI